MNNPHQQLGSWGEVLAKEYLVKQGLEIIGQNVRTPFGELDLIARDRNQIVFVEVKTRSTSVLGVPEEAVDNRKREHILAAAAHYMQEHEELEDKWRVDVIAILGNPFQKYPNRMVSGCGCLIFQNRFWS